MECTQEPSIEHKKIMKLMKQDEEVGAIQKAV